MLSISKKKTKYLLKRSLLFSILYTLSTFILIPNIAPYFGREKINDTYTIQANTFLTKLCNRNYVVPELNSILTAISLRLDKKHNGIKLVYLDANFPFFDGFPLLPHLSHNDGKKIDISFIYQNNKGQITNLKPSISGYGIYVVPKEHESNQSEKCIKNGYWYYDFTKYFTFGKINSGISISEKATRDLLILIANQSSVSKIFIEPHLKNRLQLNTSKIRFHGCQAVRHDDHIHFQIK